MMPTQVVRSDATMMLITIITHVSGPGRAKNTHKRVGGDYVYKVHEMTIRKLLILRYFCEETIQIHRISSEIISVA